MQNYEIQIKRQPEKVIRKLPRDLAIRINRVTSSLATDPRPTGHKKLTGYDELYRIRVGNWWISYAIIDDQLIVLIMEVSPRGGAYRGLTR